MPFITKVHDYDEPSLTWLSTLPRYPIAVNCWFPTGTETTPKILFFKIKDENTGEIVTIDKLSVLNCKKMSPLTSNVWEFKCIIYHNNLQRHVTIYFFSNSMKWELTYN